MPDMNKAMVKVDISQLPYYEALLKIARRLAEENPHIQAGYHQTSCALCGTTTNVHTMECLTTEARAALMGIEAMMRKKASD